MVQAALSAADKSMQAMLAQRESALKTKVEGQMKAVAKETVDKVCPVLFALFLLPLRPLTASSPFLHMQRHSTHRTHD